MTNCLEALVHIHGKVPTQVSLRATLVNVGRHLKLVGGIDSKQHTNSDPRLFPAQKSESIIHLLQVLHSIPVFTAAGKDTLTDKIRQVLLELPGYGSDTRWISCRRTLEATVSAPGYLLYMEVVLNELTDALRLLKSLPFNRRKPATR